MDYFYERDIYNYFSKINILHVVKDKALLAWIIILETVNYFCIHIKYIKLKVMADRRAFV